jgi:hypothetical protein
MPIGHRRKMYDDENCSRICGLPRAVSERIDRRPVDRTAWQVCHREGNSTVKRALFVIALFACLFGACGSSPMPTAPSSADAPKVSGSVTLSPQVISAISGTWTGTTTAAAPGVDGHISITFTSSVPGSVAAAIVWTSGDGSVHYSGTAAGTLDNLALTSASMAQTCGYKAVGAISGSTFAGTYSTLGSACRSGNGTFSATKQ